MELDQSTINSLVIVAVLAYGMFVGYCVGCAQGYSKGAVMVRELYNRK